jgi:hypothetical protein
VLNQAAACCCELIVVLCGQPVCLAECATADLGQHLTACCVHVVLCRLLQGPREDSGFSSAIDPGQRLASQVYTYCKKFHPKTQVMASGLRTKEGGSDHCRAHTATR